MADVYEMPVPKPPTDEELDTLAIQADELLSRIDVPAGARQVIRVQAGVIRKLRVALAKAEGKLAASEMVRKIASDERTAAEFGGESCPGVGTPPVARTISTKDQTGECAICDATVDLDGEVVGDHAFATDSPV